MTLVERDLDATEGNNFTHEVPQHSPSNNNLIKCANCAADK